MLDPDYPRNLDRVQIVKGWVDEKGERHERIFDVAVSDEQMAAIVSRLHDNNRPVQPLGKRELLLISD